MTDEDRAGHPQRRKPFIGFVQIAVVVVLVGLAVMYAREDGATGTPGAGGFGGPAPTARQAPVVKVIMPTAASSAVRVETTGTINVRSYVGLMPEVSGRIVDVSPALRTGGSFAANETLLRVDRRDFELAVEQARAEVASARSQLLLMQAEGDAARANYALLHPGEPVPPLVARVPQIAQGRAQVQGAEARAAIANLDLARTVFSLPFAGKITDATAEVGQMLSRGQAFGQAFSFDGLEASVPIAQDDLARLQPVEGRTATVIAGDLQLQAVVERVSAELDERTRFAKLFLTFSTSPDVAPGTFVDVVVDGPQVSSTFVLPEAAEQGGYVWLVQDGKLARHEPTVIGQSATGLVVEAFPPGEGIVVGPVPGAFDGLDVRPAADS